MNSIIKQPSAWVPVALSFAVFAAMLIYIGIAGIPVRETDEGTGAHLFQIWLVLEVLMVAFFALKWLPKMPKSALLVLMLQIAALSLPMSIVFSLKL
ncbi:MAG: hypothetical protein HY220_00055 [Candidatus Sungbacteria bacterium]|uniref:Uncharacterized protein n=1 Tax=Candidatus Sungiibacteriota bacterium TaxID=2750080 RepID=A0A9D6LMB6_9BACT|nr:hypothetical protein [Candidatus Sungbacteria bacterium]